MSTPLSRVQFTRESAERIGRVVRAAELEPVPGRALNFETVEPPPRKVFRMGTFTGSWPIGGVKTIDFTNGDNSADAVNVFFDIPDDGQKNCAIARDGTSWYLIQWQWAVATCAANV